MQGKIAMKLSTIVAIVLVAGAIYYWTDGGMKLGLRTPETLPDTVAPPNATFMGHERSNPFMAE